jgi:hypothetical protein
MFANCDYQLVNGKSSESTAQPCRAAGGVSATMVASTILKFTNNTVYTGTNAGGSSGIEWKNRNLSCNGTETYSYKNNIFVRSPLSTTNWVPFYNVDIVGACLTAWSAATTDHTIFYNFQTNPSGTGNSFTAPAWAGTVSKATYDNSSNVLLTSNVGGGTSTTFWNSSNDFNNFPQNTSIDQGALQFGTSTQLKQAGQSCVANTDCSSGTCNNFACSGSCTANGGACSTGATCCSGTCTSSLCAVANTCGDGNIQPGETCDGSNLNGSNCVLQGFTGGSLSCASNCLSFDTASCTSTTVFPLTPILDSFNRANEGPPLSSNWTTLYGGLKVSSNQVANTAGDIFSLEYWNPTNFSKDQEAYFTASTGATAMDGVSLYIKYDNVTQNGYAFRMDNPEGTMDISRVTGGTSTVLLSLAASLPPVDGDKYGLSYVSGTLKAYRNRGGSWSQIGTVADTTYQTQTGKIALGLYEFGTTARIDDFGGGSLNPVTCGNGLKETNEICDGADLVGQTCVTQGFASGTLSCATNCGSFNTSSCVTASTCGNNTKESGEICDGTDLASNTCSSRGYASGTLACASNCLSFVTTGCVSTASGVRGGMIIK